MQDKEYGKKVLTLSCAVTNHKRFDALTGKERKYAASLIDIFQKQLSAFKEELLNQGKE